MRLLSVSIFSFLLYNNNLYCISDSIIAKKNFFKIHIGIGSNLIDNGNFNYYYDGVTNIRDGIVKDYKIKNYYSYNPLIGFSFLRKIRSTNKYSFYFEVGENIILNSENYHVNGTEETFYLKSVIEKDVKNTYLSNFTYINLSVLKKLYLGKEVGLFLGGGWNNVSYYKINQSGYNSTLKEPIILSDDGTKEPNFTLGLNVGVEYKYKIKNLNLSSRLSINPQLNKSKLISFKYFDFQNKNYLTFFSTAIIL